MLPPKAPSTPSAPAGHLPVAVLRRYVAGELPPAEEHRVEAHTLGCPQCAALLEGLELQPASVTDASLHELRQRLAARVEELAEAAEPAAVPLWSWPRLAAAAVLVLLLSTVAWFALRLRPASELQEMAAVPAASSDAASQAAADPEVAAAEPALANGAAPVPPAASAPSAPSKRPAGAKLPPRGRDLAQAARQVKVGPGRYAESASEELAAASAADYAAAPSPPQTVAKQAASSSDLAAGEQARRLPEGPMRAVQGQVTDARTGEALPGVTVLVPGTQHGASTGPDGRFQLTVPAATSKLSVSSIGYTSQKYALRPTDSTLVVALAPDTKSLSEVVVVRREAPPSPISISAMPAGGYASFQRYLRDSLDYPETALSARTQGTVKLRFQVGTDGKVSDIQVVKKLSEECDAEAIRLLQEGPSWFPAVQNGRRVARKVEVSVPFKLE